MQIRTFFQNVRFLFLHKLEEPKPAEEPAKIPEVSVEPREQTSTVLSARQQDGKVAVLLALAEDLQREDPPSYAYVLRELGVDQVPHFVRRVPGKHPDDKRDDA